MKFSNMNNSGGAPLWATIAPLKTTATNRLPVNVSAAKVLRKNWRGSPELISRQNVRNTRITSTADNAMYVVGVSVWLDICASCVILHALPVIEGSPRTHRVIKFRSAQCRPFFALVV